MLNPKKESFLQFSEAMQELKRRAALPWDQPPNQAPCTSWRTCGRRYEIVEYDSSTIPWGEVQQRIAGLEMSKAGARWLVDPTTGSPKRKVPFPG